MKAFLIFSLACLFSCQLYGQEFEIYGGVNRYKLKNVRDGHDVRMHSSSIKPLVGIAMGEILRDDILSLRLEAELYNVNRKYKTSSGGLGSGTDRSGRIQTTNLSIRAYPFNFKILEGFELSFGLAWVPALNYSDTGTSYNWNIQTGAETTSYNISKKPFEIINKGMAARIAYRAKLKNNWLITPQYRFYYGTPGAIMHTAGFGLVYMKPTKRTE